MKDMRRRIPWLRIVEILVDMLFPSQVLSVDRFRREGAEVNSVPFLPFHSPERESNGKEWRSVNIMLSCMLEPILVNNLRRVPLGLLSNCIIVKFNVVHLDKLTTCLNLWIEAQLLLRNLVKDYTSDFWQKSLILSLTNFYFKYISPFQIRVIPFLVDCFSSTIVWYKVVDAGWCGRGAVLDTSMHVVNVGAWVEIHIS